MLSTAFPFIQELELLYYAVIHIIRCSSDMNVQTCGKKAKLPFVV